MADAASAAAVGSMTSFYEYRLEKIAIMIHLPDRKARGADDDMFFQSLPRRSRLAAAGGPVLAEIDAATPIPFVRLD